MKRIARFAALTCLFALWQFPGVTRARAAELPQAAAFAPPTKSTPAPACPAGGCQAMVAAVQGHRPGPVASRPIQTAAGHIVVRVRDRHPVRNLAGRFLPLRRRCGS